jgi:hypothetical protein
MGHTKILEAPGTEPKQLQGMKLCKNKELLRKKHFTTFPPLSLLLELRFQKWQSLGRYVRQLQHSLKVRETLFSVI